MHLPQSGPSVWKKGRHGGDRHREELGSLDLVGSCVAPWAGDGQRECQGGCWRMMKSP